MNLSNMLKGIGGEFEVNRVVGAVGGLSYIAGAHLFLAVDVIWLKHAFDLTAYCLSFPAGLGVAVGSIAGAVAVKDRSVAKAIQTRDGTNAPAEPQPGGQE